MALVLCGLRFAEGLARHLLVSMSMCCARGHGEGLKNRISLCAARTLIPTMLKLSPQSGW